MAKPRAFIHPDSQSGVFHVISRIVDRRMVLGDAEKEAFVAMMRAFEALHQVQVLTFCIMSNHFHLLVRVPERPAGFDPDTGTVQQLWAAAVGKEWRAAVSGQHEIYRGNGSGAAIEAWRQAIVARMFSLSEFMKALKQRFTQWYNRKAGRCGTLWESRYTSVIVEDADRALRTMATYIDLNPVRAGMVADPADYRWCGYAEAMAGNAKAQAGLQRVVWCLRAEEQPESAILPPPVEARTPAAAKAAAKRASLKALVFYRNLLGMQGRPRTREEADGTVKTVRRGISEKVQARLSREGGVRIEVLRRRVRHLSAGVILGSRQFIEEWFTSHRGWFGGNSSKRRQTGARSTGQRELRGLYTVRALKSP